MKDLIYDMTKEEYNELESFECFIDNVVHVMFEKGSIESLDSFIEDPIYEVLREDNMDLEMLENICMEEESVVCPYAQFEPSISNTNEDIEKWCSEELDGMLLIEDLSQPLSSRVEVPYNQEQLGDNTQSY